MAHDHQLPVGDREDPPNRCPTCGTVPRGGPPLGGTRRDSCPTCGESARHLYPPALMIVPLGARLSHALEALDSFNRALFVPSIVVRRRLTAAIDEVEAAARDALKDARARKA